MAMFRGDDSRESMVAAMRFATFVETVIGFFEGLGKRG
jgi:hypothetical protein